jgi:hypothetical protein
MRTIPWIACGKISFCEKEWPKFPEVEAIPGLYRLILDDGWFYIGQARNLRHRLYEYRRPTPGVVVEHSVHRALKNAGGAIVELFTSADLADGKMRCDLEKREIENARLQGLNLLNGGPGVEAYRLRLDITYHEIELERLRSQLSAISGEE